MQNLKGKHQKELESGFLEIVKKCVEAFCFKIARYSLPRHALTDPSGFLTLKSYSKYRAFKNGHYLIKVEI